MTEQTDKRIENLVRNAYKKHQQHKYRKLDGCEMIWVFQFITENDDLTQEEFVDRVKDLRVERKSIWPESSKRLQDVLLMCA